MAQCFCVHSVSLYLVEVLKMLMTQHKENAPGFGFNLDLQKLRGFER